MHVFVRNLTFVPSVKHEKLRLAFKGLGVVEHYIMYGDLQIGVIWRYLTTRSPDVEYVAWWACESRKFTVPRTEHVISNYKTIKGLQNAVRRRVSRQLSGVVRLLQEH